MHEWKEYHTWESLTVADILLVDGYEVEEWTIVVTLVCAGITFAEIQNIRYAKQVDTPTTIHPIRLIACIAIVIMGIYSLITGHYILNV